MQNKEPESLSEQGATCFEHEVARLMDRYKIPDAEKLLKAQSSDKSHLMSIRMLLRLNWDSV